MIETITKKDLVNRISAETSQTKVIVKDILQRFLDHVEKHDRVWIARRVDIARHWRATHPFDADKAFVWG